jgi:bacillithiol synthase
MQSHQISLGEVNQFSPLFLDYISQKDSLKQFYGNYPDIQGFEAQIKAKNFSAESRKTLVSVLEKQYQHLPNKPDFSILLDEKTFTVTTGHQLNIFTGPLYVVYKLLTVIKLAQKLKENFPDYNFVPIYWMATEDHDFAEIDHFSLFGKSYQWQTQQQGAVGRMNPKELEALLSEMPEKPSVFENAYLQNDTLANAVRQYSYELFGNQSLICIDADDSILKKQFEYFIKTDIINNSNFSIVNESSELLEKSGYKPQISPREINFFYLEDGLRERIVKEGNEYKVLNTNLSFTEGEIIEMIESSPEKFSPNVVLRPVYQEVILPNLAYIGGPSEVPYWLQLRGIFDKNNVPFPILMPRNFALVVNRPSGKKMEKLELSVNDLFLDEVTLRKTFVEKNSSNSLSLSSENESFAKIFEAILQKAILVDKTLEGAVNGEKQKLTNSVENLEKRLKKAEERNQETEVSQLLALKQKLFPNGGLQERSENFLNFYLNNPEFLTQMLDIFDPLDFSFYVVME